MSGDHPTARRRALLIYLAGLISGALLVIITAHAYNRDREQAIRQWPA